jgi:Ca2+-binding RTX toxin-like protein
MICPQAGAESPPLRIKDSIMTRGSEFIERLEDRKLLSSVVLKGRHLTVTGDAVFGNDISVGFDGATKNILLNVNGAQYGYGLHSVTIINLIGGAGNDFLHVDESLTRFTIRMQFFPGEGNNTVVGGYERDKIICGGGGDDTIYTGSGDDTVIGGRGNDTIVAASGLKLIYAARGDNNISLTHSRGYVFGGQGHNVITSSGDNTEIFGGSGDDTLTGGGRDTLWGQGGHDVLSGGTERHYDSFKGLQNVKRRLFPDIPVL